MMYLEYGGKSINASIVDRSMFQSPHTGRQLERVRVNIVVNNKQDHEIFLDAIMQARNESINSIDKQGNILKNWRVTKNSFSNNNSAPEYWHDIELEEVENLVAEALVFGELEFSPYFYKEEFDENAIIITANVLISEEEYNSLNKMGREQMGRYFPVIRYGISERPLEMRFGRPLWSKDEKGIKYQIILVEKNYDKNSHPMGLSTKEMLIIKDKLSHSIATLEGLIDKLMKKGLLKNEELEDIKARASDMMWDIKAEFYQVDDIDSERL